jgi:hypothetical protein
MLAGVYQPRRETSAGANRAHDRRDFHEVRTRADYAVYRP